MSELSIYTKFPDLLIFKKIFNELKMNKLEANISLIILELVYCYQKSSIRIAHFSLAKFERFFDYSVI